MFRLGGERATVYYELRSVHANGDPLVVHVSEWRPESTGSLRVDREFPVTGAQGTVAVEGLMPSSIVRAAVGRRRHGRFGAISVAVEAVLTPAGPEVTWSPRSRRDYGDAVRRAASHVVEP